MPRDATNADSSTSAATLMSSVVFVWGTSSCNWCSVSTPEPGGKPTGSSGNPHTSPSDSTLRPAACVYGPNVTPPTVTENESSGPHESNASTCRERRATECAGNPSTVRVTCPWPPNRPKPPKISTPSPAQSPTLAPTQPSLPMSSANVATYAAVTSCGHGDVDGVGDGLCVTDGVCVGVGVGEPVWLGVRVGLGVWEGVGVGDGVVDGVGVDVSDTHAPEATLMTTLSMANDSSNAPAKLDRISIVAELPVWGTLSSTYRTVSRPLPASAPSGFSGAPHKSVTGLAKPAPVDLSSGPAVTAPTLME